MKWTLYHGTTESRYLSLRVADNKFTHSNGEKHLLGTGIYLYEDPTHARVWARKKPPQYEGDKPFIIAVDIELDDLEVRYTNQKETDRNVTRHFRTEKQYCLKDDTYILDMREWKGE